MDYDFGIRSLPPCGDCWENGHCSMNCGPRIERDTMGLIAIKYEGKREVHISSTNNGNYDTYCGLDGDDPECGQEPDELGKSTKITCIDCLKLWEIAQNFKRSDFRVKQS